MPEPPSGVPPTAATSLAGRLFNVYAAPGDVFDEIKAAPPSTANWLVPALLSAFVGVLATIILFSQPAIIQQLHEQQAKTFDDQVNAGKMTRDQADQAEAMIGKFTGPATLMISGSISAVISAFARVFWWALVLWLLGLVFLKTKLDYLKAVEVAGLASMIVVLGTIVTLLLSVSLGKITAPSLALCVGNFSAKNPLHLTLAAMNLFALWLTGVLAVGLSRLTGARFSKALLLTGGFWLVMQFCFILLAVLVNAISSAAK